MGMDSETENMNPEYNPQAIVDYYNNSDGKGGTRKGMNDLLIKARQHLLSVGWSLSYFTRQCGKKEVRYSSPNVNRKYLSLRTACKAYLDSQELEKSISLKRELCSVDDVDNVPSYLSRQCEKRELWIDLFADGGYDDIVIDLNDCSVDHIDDTGREECKLDEGVKRRKIIGGKDMNIVYGLKRSRVDDLCLSGGDDFESDREDDCESDRGDDCESDRGDDCESDRGVDKRKIGAKGLRDVDDQAISVDNQLKSANNGIVTQNLGDDQNDDVCSICRNGGDLVLCDQCPSAFHADCLGLSGVPASEFWYCQSCCCGICGKNICKDDSRHDKQCDQCEKNYHVKCIGEYYVAEMEWKKWFCGKKCEDISFGLDRLLGKPIVVDGKNLTWTLLKNNNDFETNRKLKRAIAVMHECFKPVKEPWGGRDVGEDVIFSRKSDLKQLDFRGFYTVILQKGKRVVTFATVRVFGDKVAEVPFIATRNMYRRQGMCKILMNVLEEKLIDLGVQKMVLPAMPSVLDTWTSPSFAFTKMTASDRSMLMGYTFLEFPGTIACQKLLQRLEVNL